MIILILISIVFFSKRGIYYAKYYGQGEGNRRGGGVVAAGEKNEGAGKKGGELNKKKG